MTCCSGTIPAAGKVEADGLLIQEFWAMERLKNDQVLH